MGRSEKEKRMRKAMRDLVNKAYERELSQALSGLEAQFKAWRDGGISCFRLNELIHEHHDGVSRDLWKKYGLHAEMLLPGLVVNGVILESEVPEELLAEMRQTIQSLREFQKNWPETPEVATDSGKEEDHDRP